MVTMYVCSVAGKEVHKTILSAMKQVRCDTLSHKEDRQGGKKWMYEVDLGVVDK